MALKNVLNSTAKPFDHAMVRGDIGELLALVRQDVTAAQ